MGRLSRDIIAPMSMIVPINDPPPMLADLNRAIWYARLDEDYSITIVEFPAGSFTPSACKGTSKSEGPPMESFRDAVVAALRLARRRGAAIEPSQWPRYFPG
jgi:hypothetical protein